MASKSRNQRKPRPRGDPMLAQFGIDLSGLDDMNSDDSGGDDNDLESELEAILSGKAPTKRQTKKPDAPGLNDVMSAAAECLKDEDEDDDDDENLSGDEELMNQLLKLTVNEPASSPMEEERESAPPIPPERKQSSSSGSSEKQSNPQSSTDVLSTLHNRLGMYKEAIHMAEQGNDKSKARRYGRALKTLEGLIKTAKSGSAINEEDIPPEVKVPKAVPSPVAPSQRVPPTPPATTNITGPKVLVPDQQPQCANPMLQEVIARQAQYKRAALEAKKAGDKASAMNYLRSSKAFDSVIEAMKNNGSFDLSNLPPPFDSGSFPGISKEQVQTSGDKVGGSSPSSSIEAAALAAAEGAENLEIFAAPAAPASVMEALEQRLEKYKRTKLDAEKEGNSSKVRRLQRIVKNYETAIKDYKAGKTIDFEELPTPPGFGPIPVVSKAAETPKPKPPVQPKAPVERAAPPIPKPATQPADSQPKKPKLQRANTISDKQLEFLLERQKLFRQAALTAKQNGDIQQAKEYLRMSKGFDSMIEATKCGLPIDASSIPTPPQLESDFVVVDVSDCMDTNKSQDELYETLETDLQHQIEICIRNKAHFLKLGDVSSASKFEKLGVESKKDLTIVKSRKKNADPAPRFHYETRLFSMVQCNTDLGDNDLEVRVERGINLPGKPDDLDSFVKIEFPIPSEAPQIVKGSTIYDTNNPTFEQDFKFEINRKSRSQLRQFKRGIMKIEIYSRRGFLRSNALLGTVHIKLVDLESKCTIHDSFDLMDGRKACGGKLEVKVKIREPLLTKQVEEVREKWLVVGT